MKLRSFLENHQRDLALEALALLVFTRSKRDLASSGSRDWLRAECWDLTTRFLLQRHRARENLQAWQSGVFARPRSPLVLVGFANPVLLAVLLDRKSSCRERG